MHTDLFAAPLPELIDAVFVQTLSIVTIAVIARIRCRVTPLWTTVSSVSSKCLSDMGFSFLQNPCPMTKRRGGLFPTVFLAVTVTYLAQSWQHDSLPPGTPAPPPGSALSCLEFSFQVVQHRVYGTQLILGGSNSPLRFLHGHVVLLLGVQPGVIPPRA